jgi:hypothetical protein
MRTTLALVISLVGILLFLQASDLNPLLFSERYSNWFHTTIFITKWVWPWFFISVFGGAYLIKKAEKMLQ